MTLRCGVLDARRASVPWTGIGRYVTALVEYLPRTAPSDVPVFVGGRGLRLSGQPSDGATDVVGRLGKLVWEQARFPAWLWAHKPAFVHLPYFEGPLVPGIPLVVTVHDLDMVLHPNRYSRKWRAYYLTLFRRYLERAGRIIVPSITTAADLQDLIGPSDRVVIVPQGIDPAFHDPDPKRGQDLLERLGVPPCSNVIITGAGVGIRKNLGVLSSACARLTRACGLPVSVIISGTSTMPSAMGEAIVAGVQVLPLGTVSTSDLAAAYSAADVSVTASLYEGFGFAVVESMAAGCPVLASDVGSHAEVAGGAALLFDPLRPDELADRLRTVLTDRTLRTNLAVAGRRRAADFGWTTTAERTAAVYAEISA